MPIVAEPRRIRHGVRFIPLLTFWVNNMRTKTGFLLLMACTSCFVGCQRAPDIDQVGGTKLTYKFHQDGEEIDAKAAKEAMARRLAFIPGVRVQASDEEMDILVPKGSDLESAKRLSGMLGDLALLVVASPDDPQTSRAIDAAGEDTGRYLELNGEVVAVWHQVAKDTDDEFRASFDARTDFLREPTEGTLEVALRKLPTSIEGKHLKTASRGFDSRDNPALDFTMTEEGAKRLGDLTSANKGQRLAIVFDGEVISAPRINDRIFDRGQISGNFTQDEIDEMIAILRAGRLPFRFTDDPPSEQEISPKVD